MAARKATSLIIQNREPILPLTRLAKAIPGGPFDYRSLKLWCTVGRKGVVMESIKSHGNGLWSSVEAYWRFLGEINKEAAS